ncbi:hypothetical protein M0804_012874 [Polistes exclamans]|nr:hypothetical protein M0804_012874 [Polistes exclamans]
MLKGRELGLLVGRLLGPRLRSSPNNRFRIELSPMVFLDPESPDDLPGPYALGGGVGGGRTVPRARGLSYGTVKL